MRPASIFRELQIAPEGMRFVAPSHELRRAVVALPCTSGIKTSAMCLPDPGIQLSLWQRQVANLTAHAAGDAHLRRDSFEQMTL